MRARLKYIHRYTDRHGHLRYYFKRNGFKSVALPNLPGTQQFMLAYNAALANAVPVEGLKEYNISTDEGPGAKRSVYFLGSGDHVKIGISKDIKRRTRRLSTSHHHDLVLLAKIENADYKLEGELHKRFAAHRVRREWFKMTPEIQSFIDGINNGHADVATRI